MKSVLAVGLAVARPRVAAQPREDRDDVLGEIPRPRRPRLERDPRRGRLAFQGRLDRDNPSPDRPEITARLELDQSRRLNCPLDLGRQVSARVPFVSSRQELQTGIVCRYGEGLGRNPQCRPRRLGRLADGWLLGPARGRQSRDSPRKSGQFRRFLRHRAASTSRRNSGGPDNPCRGSNPQSDPSSRTRRRPDIS